MDNFDYRKFLTENKLTKVSAAENGKAKIITEGFDMDTTLNYTSGVVEGNAQKDAYLKRQERAKKGNWKGSIGAFVEEHGEELRDIIGKNRQQLKDYVENVMKPELTSEAKAKVDELFDSKKSVIGFVQSLYNHALKGAGMGLDENVEDMEEFDDTMEEEMLDEERMESLDLEPVKDILRMLRNAFREAGHMDHGMVSVEFRAGEPVEVYHNGDMIGQIDIDENLNEAIEQKYKGTPQEKGTRRKDAGKGYKGKKAGQDQDKMAKSEMTGEKMDVTIGGVTKSISKRDWTKYRKMTDPEEKKAWKQRHGFIK